MSAIRAVLALMFAAIAVYLALRPELRRHPSTQHPSRRQPPSPWAEDEWDDEYDRPRWLCAVDTEDGGA